MPRVADEIARFLEGDRPNASASLRFAAGALIGACFAGFTPILLGLWLFGGREMSLRDGGALRVDLASFLYPLGAVVSGGLFVLLVSQARNRLAAAAAGPVALLPWLAGIGLCLDHGYGHWQTLHTVTTVVTSLALGAPLGWIAQPALGRRGRQPTQRTAV